MAAIVSEIMSRQVIGLEPAATLEQARTLMQRRHIRHLPVVEQQRLLGLVSQRDILAAQESSLESGTNGDFLNSHTLADIMTRAVTTISPRAGIREAALYLQKHKYGCLPVVDKGKLVGIVTDSDFVAVAINLLEVLDNQLAGEAEIDTDIDDMETELNQSREDTDSGSPE
ncbi:CBS domain-containing protein [Zobellella maritima]|uniref:CBS domain-containing protein n=1 Tax=Zobellella maritima TaxID=2059725 RepID=UPI000E3004CB|nr:CBS domain-containing protein [Zobellella maritima]